MTTRHRSRRRAKPQGATQVAKLFRNGRSQAVRLPQEYRFRGHEVSIRREGLAVILEPVAKRSWPRGFFERLGGLGADFVLPEDVPPSPIHLDLD